MKKTQLFLLSAFALLCLTACEQKKTTYNYLVQHPEVLKNEVERCQNGTQTDTAFCSVVENAALAFQAMVTDEQQEPEKFGERLLDMQQSFLKQKQALQAAQKAVNDLRAKQAPQADLQAAQQKLSQVQKAFVEQRNEMKMMLAVVKVNISPN